MPRLSLCMIVKDEARFLGACLASARGAVDEIVVVDTGSSDETPAIAREAGARVLDFPWRDDFAAARNASLDAASGTHVLVLDADEVLVAGKKGSASALRKAIESPRLAIGMLPLSDADALGALPEDVVSGERRLWPPVHLPRLFQNHPRLRFRRRVHETLFTDIDGTLRELGGTIAGVDAPIVHYGEVRTLRREKEKSERNVRLLEAALREDPADGDLAGYLAAELVRAQDPAGAERVAREHLAPFLERLDRMPAGALKPSPIQLASVLATLELQHGRASDALATARAAHARCPAPHPNLRFLEGAALERLGELEAAERAFRECLAMDGQAFTIPVNPGATGAAARLRLANVLIARGRAAESLEQLEGVTGKLAVAAALACAEAFLALGEPALALQTLAPLLGQPDPMPDLFALAARAAAQLGARDPALESAAASAPESAWLEPRRRALAPARAEG